MEMQNTVAGYRLPVTREYKIQLQVPCYKLQGNANTVAGYRLPVAREYKIQLQDPCYKFHGNAKYRFRLHVSGKANTVAGLSGRKTENSEPRTEALETGTR
jgi:hypothetical protein